MDLNGQFYRHLLGLFDEEESKNRETLKTLGAVIGKSFGEGGVLHTFGSGHSGILAQEMVHRAGGLVPVSAIVDPTGGWTETLPGYGTELVKRHHYNYELLPGETIIVISNSGKNPCPIEVALACRKLGLTVAAVTSLAMSRKAKSGHACGKRLFEVADHVLDNGGEIGDAAIPIPGHPDKAGPTSTLSGALLLNLLLMEIIEYLTLNNLPVPILRSANMPGAREYNAEISAQYKHRLSRPI